MLIEAIRQILIIKKEGTAYVTSIRMLIEAIRRTLITKKEDALRNPNTARDTIRYTNVQAIIRCTHAGETVDELEGIYKRCSREN